MVIAVMNAPGSGNMILMWASLSGDGGVSEMTNIGRRAEVEVADRI